MVSVIYQSLPGSLSRHAKRNSNVIPRAPTYSGAFNGLSEPGFIVSGFVCCLGDSPEIFQVVELGRSRVQRVGALLESCGSLFDFLISMWHWYHLFIPRTGKTTLVMASPGWRPGHHRPGREHRPQATCVRRQGRYAWCGFRPCIAGVSHYESHERYRDWAHHASLPDPRSSFRHDTLSI